MTPHLVDLAFLFFMVVLLSAGVLLWLKSLKKQPSLPVQVAVLACLVALVIAGLRFSGSSMGILSPAATSENGASNPFREALTLLNEPYPTYTTTNNLSGANREVLVERFQKIERLDLKEVKLQVQTLRGMIQQAPASGLQGIYNMHITSDIQARWDDLRQELVKRAQ